LPAQLRLLVVEDSDDDYVILLREVRKAGYSPLAERVATAAELEAALARPWDLMITDWLLPGFGGLAALEMLTSRGLDLPCIVISGTPSEEAAVSALRAGALDFLSKDRPLRFVPAIERALRESAERRARRAAERELRLSEERYRLAFLVAPEALLTYDLDRHRIVDANPAALRLFGYTLEELREVALGGLSLPAQSDGVFDWTYRTKDGTLVPTETRHAKLPSAGANLARVTILDLRDRMRIDEMRHHALELELQNRRIQEANRLKSEFLANMSHELRTPLNAIIGFAELLHDGQVDPASPQHEEFLGDILASGRHLLQLINDVLDLAKVEAGKLDFRSEPAELERLVVEVVAITRTIAASKRITVTTDVAPGLTGIVIDPNRFKQVVYNYLSNALKFTPEGGRIAIRVTPENEACFRLEVEDTGVGIAPADLGRLFIEFQQLEAGAAKRHQGTGLGLALTRRLVEAQGGSVGVRSTPGKGSIFHAVLPRHARADTTTVTVTGAQARLGARSVLVVEDDSRDRELIATALGAAGYAIESARTGAEALARCRARSFDAFTLDLLLPDMSGLDLLAVLRAEGYARTAPVVVVSVVPDARQIAGFAVTDVLRKPLDRDSLLRVLDRAGVRPDKPGGILVVDDDPGALKLMDATLAQLGYSAITRSTGAAALSAAVQLGPRAVVLDLMMPEMDGIEFLDRFRRLPAHARTPVLIWTIKDLSESEHVKLQQSAQAIVSKTESSPSTIVAQLRTLLAEPGGR
jgi:signal transduction histidine kinase/DNA-binding LytR/AlgR family response regulator